jgi:hypothetical protein
MKSTTLFDSPLITAAKRGMKVGNREVRAGKVKRMRLPTPYLFVSWARYAYWESGDIDDRMTYLGTAMSYNYGMRSNEYCHDSGGKGTSAIRSQDVFFVDKTGDRYLAHDHRIRGMCTSDIVTAVAEMNAGKTLTDGRNRKLFLDRAASVVEAQLLEDLFNFCKESGSEPEDLLLSRYRQGRNKRLVPKMVSALLKAAAVIFGLPELMFSTHCNRIGCASDLHAYGYDDDDLRQFIGWKSDSSLLYQCPSRKDPSALRAGAGGGTLTIGDITNLVPAGRSAELEEARSRAKAISVLSSL